MDAAASGARLRAGRIALREPEASCWMSGAVSSSRQHFSGHVDNAGKPCGANERAYGKTVWSFPQEPFMICQDRRKILNMKTIIECS